MSMTLLPYQPSDAAMIASWLKSEYLMRQWCADRYDRYPVMPEDINSYHEKYIDGQQSRALTMTDGDDIVGYITYVPPPTIRPSSDWDSSLLMIQNVVAV